MTTTRESSQHSTGTRWLRVGLCVASMLWGSALAADIDVTRQALVLVRALAYDRNLLDRAGTTVGIGVLYQPGSGDVQSRQVHEAFSALGGVKVGGLPLEVSLVEWRGAAALATTLTDGGVDALYICPGLSEQVEAITETTRANGVLTLGSERDYVEAGMALGVFDKGGEPKLAINIGASKAEGASFSAELLRLAEIIR